MSQQLTKISNKAGSDNLPTLPRLVTIEASRSCQLKCPACIVPTLKSRSHFTEKLLEHLLTSISWPIDAINFGWSGEPLLNKDLPRLVSRARLTGAKTNINTNGMLLSKVARELVGSGVDFIQVAVDGINQETLTKYRVGGSYERIIRGVEDLVRMREDSKSSTPEVSMQMVVTKHNEKQKDEFVRLARFLGADRVYFKAFSIDIGQHKSSAERDRIAADFLPETGEHRYSESDIGTSGCLEPQDVLTVRANGDVVLCCNDISGVSVLGNIHEDSVADIWRGARARKARRDVRNETQQLCKGCSYPIAKHLNETIVL